MQQIKQVIKRIIPEKIWIWPISIWRFVKKDLRRMHLPNVKRRLLCSIQIPYRMVAAKKRALPDFLIIGTQKGGTTSLYSLLAQHPQIHTSKIKEVRYFGSEFNYKKGQLWYRAHFPLRDTITPGELVGEATPGYLASPKASKRIQKDFPNAKLICILRNPTEKAVSSYFMRLRSKKEHLPIMEAMLDESAKRGYKKRGLYFEQLKRYEKYLEKNQLLILSSEEFFANPQKVLKQVFGFLGVDETFQCPDLSARNIGENKIIIFVLGAMLAWFYKSWDIMILNYSPLTKFPNTA